MKIKQKNSLCNTEYAYAYRKCPFKNVKKNTEKIIKASKNYLGTIQIDFHMFCSNVSVTCRMYAVCTAWNLYCQHCIYENEGTKYKKITPKMEFT